MVLASRCAVGPIVVLCWQYNGYVASLPAVWYYPSVCLQILNNMLKLVLRKLHHLPIAKVQFPDEEKMQQFAQLACTCEPSVQDVIDFMDGVSFTSECTSEKIQQNAFYCGYDCDTVVNNVFAYGPDGKVFFCALNYPGSWADGTLTVHFLPHILK